MKDATLPGNKTSRAKRVSLFPGHRLGKVCLHFEKQAWAEGYTSVAGLDEVGRGCLAGPVVAAACILDPAKRLPKGLNDSKKLTPDQRQDISAKLKACVIAYAIGQVEADEIDRINILEATKKAMRLACTGLPLRADYLLIDALRLKDIELPQMPIIGGDGVSASIAAASVLAKTYRDGLMAEYHTEFPHYGLDSNKGYGCRSHYDAIREHGPSPIHRLTFRGVVRDPGDPAQSMLFV